MNRLLCRRATLTTLGALVLATALPAAAQTVEAGGVKFAETVKVGGRDLRLNGAGVRVRAIIKVYAMALYLPKKEADPAAVLASQGPRRLHLSMLREVSGEDFGQAFMNGINANSDKAEKGKLVNQMVKLGEMFVAVGGLKKGDSIFIDWIPEKGTLIEMNGKPLIEPLPDVAFYNALIKIWLGDKPADSSLKPALLGAKPD